MSTNPEKPPSPPDAKRAPKRVADLPTLDFTRATPGTRGQSRRRERTEMLFGITSLADVLRAAKSLLGK